MRGQDLYFTQNLYEASYLVCIGCQVKGKERSGNKVRIKFEPDAAQKALGFYNGDKVEARTLTDIYRRLKDYVFEG